MKKRIPNNNWISIREQILSYIYKQMSLSETGNPIVLPSDKEFTKQFNCSLSPVKKALEDLKLKGIVKRKQGRRTITVQPTESISEVPDLTGLSEKARFMGTEVKNNVMYWGAAESIPECEDLKYQFEPDKMIYRLKRLRFLNSEPRVIQDTYFCDFADAFPSNVIAYHNFANSSLFDFYRTYKYYIVNRITIVQAVNLDENSANLLNVSINEPVLKSNQVTYAKYDDSNDEFVLEYMESFYTKWKYIITGRKE